MAQKSIAYAVARTRVNEGRLITDCLLYTSRWPREFWNRWRGLLRAPRVCCIPTMRPEERRF